MKQPMRAGDLPPWADALKWIAQYQMMVLVASWHIAWEAGHPWRHAHPQTLDLPVPDSIEAEGEHALFA